AARNAGTNEVRKVCIAVRGDASDNAGCELTAVGIGAVALRAALFEENSSGSRILRRGAPGCGEKANRERNRSHSAPQTISSFGLTQAHAVGCLRGRRQYARAFAARLSGFHAGRGMDRSIDAGARGAAGGAGSVAITHGVAHAIRY